MQLRLLKVMTPKLTIINYIVNREQSCSVREGLFPFTLYDALGASQGKIKNGWLRILYIIPQ